MSAGNAPAIAIASEVPEVETELLGFKALSQGGAGPKKVKLLPKPWPRDHVPPASATLFSIASVVGLVAAAGPDTLVVATTEKLRKAFDGPADTSDVVSDFTPDVTLPIPTLRHVAFSTNGEFLVVSAEQKGGLAVFNAAAVTNSGKRDAEIQIETDQVSLRALAPNPASEFSHYFAIVLESGKLAVVNVDNGSINSFRADGVTSVSWSMRGKALVAGLQDGTAAIYRDGTLKAVIPRPPEVDETFAVSGLTWLNNDEFLLVHSIRHADLQDPQDSKYHIVKSSNSWTSFAFHPFPWDPLLVAPEIPQRNLPARFSAMRLRDWQPDLKDMLIISSSHTDTIAVLASTSTPISNYQEKCNEIMFIAIDDSKKAAVPRTVFGDDADSAIIGEGLDLSSTETIKCPVPALVEEGINDTAWPLPAYMALTHEGLLAAWWVVWNRSIEKGTRYPGLIFGSEASKADAPSTASVTTTPAKPASSQATSAFGQPSTTPSNTAGSSGFGFGTPASGLMKPTPPGFGTPAFGSTTPLFGKPAQSAQTPQPSQPQSVFGKPTAASPFGAASSSGTPGASAFGKPSFGTASAIGAGASPFGAAGGLGNKASPWGAPSQPTQAQANPFAAGAGGSSGFAKFGQAGGGSGFSSFASNNGTGSGFGGLGQSQQKAGFGGLKTEPSFGSTVTVASTTGSTLPSWANTPAQGSGSLFGAQSKSSFNTSSFESKGSDMSDAEDAQRRQRDEATPTPQAPPPQKSEGLFGLAGGFKLGTTFTSDGTATDDPAKPAAPANGSFFGSDFGGALGASGLAPPATPAKEAPENMSTTPATAPKQKSLFPSTTPAKFSDTPKAAPPTKENVSVEDAPLPPDFITHKLPKMDDAPLPPDFITTKASKSTDDELPPLAGSPGIKVEAPSSDIEVTQLDDEDDEEEFSSEGDDGDEEGESEEEEEEQSPVSKPQPPKSGGWTFQDSVNQSPRIFPPAPTPPAVKSTATSLSGRSASPAQPSLFGQKFKPASSQPAYGGSSLFGQPKGPVGPSKLSFPPPVDHTQDGLRSPSPVRSTSTNTSRTRREPLTAPGASLSSSVQIDKPPTPEVSDLEDKEDERMREQLARPIEPSRDLEEFVAYQGYSIQTPKKTGHAAQIEMLYIDINGMVDALGWNARSIKSFTQYHRQPQPGHKVDRRALEEIEEQGPEGSWFEGYTLGEIGALKALEHSLEDDLDKGRVQDVLGKLAQSARLLSEKAKLMTRLNEIRRQIINRKDPAKAEALRNAPLSKELVEGQKALRRDYAQLLISLNKAEEAVSLLRSRLASHNAQNGKADAMPTMEAVKRTVLKMAAMAEKRNNDITLLESQLRKLGVQDSNRPLSSSLRTQGTPRRGRGESPVTTPSHRSKLSLSELNRRALTPEVDATSTSSRGYGLFYTPDGSPKAGKELSNMSDLVDRNLDSLREMTKRRRTVAAGLKNALIERGVKITTIN